MTVPDPSLMRRVAYLERRIRELELSLARSPLDAKRVERISGRLWCFSLNENMGATTAGEADADLLGLDETDTGLDVTVIDPFSIFTDLASGASGLCVEQLDVDGTLYYVVIQAECPA